MSSKIHKTKNKIKSINITQLIGLYTGIYKLCLNKSYHKRIENVYKYTALLANLI